MQFVPDHFDPILDFPEIEPLEETRSAIGEFGEMTTTAIDLLNSYVPVFVGAFLVTLLITPLVRRAAVAAGIIDHPDVGRKQHQFPIAYLGGLAVFLGLLVGIGISYAQLDPQVVQFREVPFAIIIGMFAIAITGFADDVWGWDPRLKIMGQLIAAAALAYEVESLRGLAAGMMKPIFPEEMLAFTVATPIGEIPVDLVYWVSTALIAVFVLGGCNAANLIDGLDGLLSGVVAIVAVGLLLISLLMVSAIGVVPGMDVTPEESLAGARVVLCVALLGAVLGFLPHNFNPASIFLGDCGSLLLGYMCVVIILMFGEMGQTHLVFAGLIVFAIPIIDTMLAIIRRWLAGVPMSSGDDQHLHHQLKRAMGGVKRAVVGLYGISAVFAFVGVTLAALVMFTELRVRVVYVIALVLFGCIAVLAVKAARRQQLRIATAKRSTIAAETPSAENNGEQADSTGVAEGVRSHATAVRDSSQPTPTAHSPRSGAESRESTT